MKDCCSVVNQDCISPANLSPRRHVKSTCFCCGLPVCIACSKVIEYLSFGRKRICDRCCDDMEQEAKDARERARQRTAWERAERKQLAALKAKYEPATT